MKALSLKQPYASFIYYGAKVYETRTWQTRYRGPLLICSSKSLSTGNIWLKIPNSSFHISMPGNEYVKKYRDFEQVTRMQFPVGVAMCIVDLVNCRTMTEDDEDKSCCKIYPGAYVWELENLRHIKPFEVKGMLSLFEVDDKLISPNT